MYMRKLECANYKIIMVKTENLHGQNRIGMVKTELSVSKRIVMVKQNCHGQTELPWSNRIVMVKNRIAMVKQNWHGELIAGLEALSPRPEREASSDHNVARAQ